MSYVCICFNAIGSMPLLLPWSPINSNTLARDRHLRQQSHTHKRGRYNITLPMAIKAGVEPVIKVGPWGREEDVDNWSFQIPTGGYIKEITIATGAVLDSLVFTIQDGSGAQLSLKYGGRGGTGDPSKVELGSNEYITSIAGAYGTWKNAVYVTSLTFITNLKTYGPYGYDYDRPSGATGVVKFSHPVLQNAKVAGFYGYADNYIDRIGFYTKPVEAGGVIIVGPWGRETSSKNGSTVGNIKEITVGHGVVIDSLTITIQDASGQEKKVKFGGNGGGPSNVKLASGEYITSIAGAYGNWKNQKGVYVTGIEFITNLGTTYGPYGHVKDNPQGVTTDTVLFSSPSLENAEVVGFFAYFDNYIQNIGIYIKPYGNN